MTCLSCKHKSNTVEPFWDLSLEFPERYHSVKGSGSSSAYQRSCTLTEMLSKFTEMEALEGNIYACNHCNSESCRHDDTNPPVPQKHAEWKAWQTHTQTDDLIRATLFLSNFPFLTFV